MRRPRAVAHLVNRKVPGPDVAGVVSGAAVGVPGPVADGPDGDAEGPGEDGAEEDGGGSVAVVTAGLGLVLAGVADGLRLAWCVVTRGDGLCSGGRTGTADTGV